MLAQQAKLGYILERIGQDLFVNIQIDLGGFQQKCVDSRKATKIDLLAGGCAKAWGHGGRPRVARREKGRGSEEGPVEALTGVRCALCWPEISRWRLVRVLHVSAALWQQRDDGDGGRVAEHRHETCGGGRWKISP